MKGPGNVVTAHLLALVVGLEALPPLSVLPQAAHSARCAFGSQLPLRAQTPSVACLSRASL